MKPLLSLLIPLLSACYFNHNGGLEEETQTLELTYIAWACDCANWATPEDLHRHRHNHGDTLAKKSIFIEPAYSSLELPDTLGYNGDLIRFTGRFYKERGFAKGYRSFQNPDKARVFRYIKYEVLESHYSEYKEISME